MKITNCFFVFVVLFCNSAIAETTNNIPSDVISFIENADACQHFSGEWDNSVSKQRQQEIESAVDKYCGQAKEQQTELSIKYKGNKSIEKEISNFSFE